MRFLLVFLFLTPVCLLAQSLSRQSIHSLGGSLQTAGVGLQQTLGQSSNFAVFGADGLSLRQGFLQGYADGASLSVNQGEWLIFPNPNDGTFTLSADFSYSGFLKVLIFNSIGQQVSGLECPANGALPVTLSLAPGLYILKAVLPSGKNIHSRFIIAK